MSKERIDKRIVTEGYANSRNKAVRMIMAGEVFADGQRIDKPGMKVSDDAIITVADKERYVSRAGKKLESANKKFEISFKGKTVLDVGSSTGGFTDYALQNGAKKVYAVDVGTNQLEWKLRNDDQVVVMEQTDVRDLQLTQQARNNKKQGPNDKQKDNEASLPEIPDIVTIDVSFISLKKVLPAVKKLVNEDTKILAMAKPQFETDKATADKHKGVIKNDTIRRDILNALEYWLKGEFYVIDKADSELSGQKGNVERFFLLKKVRK